MPFQIPRASRVVLGLGYAGLATAGTWFLTDPSELLQTQMGRVVYGWALFLVVGSVLSLAGTLTRLWIGEFGGLVLLFFGNLAWAVVLVAAAFGARNSTSAKYGVVLVSMALCAFAYRWFEIRGKVREDIRGKKAGRRRGRL